MIPGAGKALQGFRRFFMNPGNDMGRGINKTLHIPGKKPASEDAKPKREPLALFFYLFMEALSLGYAFFRAR